MSLNQQQRIDCVRNSNPQDASKLVFQWVKTGTINLREFNELYPLIDKPGRDYVDRLYGDI